MKLTDINVQLCLSIAAITLMPVTAQAGFDSSTRLESEDWLLVCDNDQTCRAAGYSPKYSPTDNVVSVLLTRPYGAELLSGKMVYHTPAKLTKPFVLTIGRASYGQIPLSNTSVGLSDTQVSAILANVTVNKPHHDEIQFISGDQVFTLSDKGLKAVLKKMDEVQQRTGTTAGLIDKGETPFDFSTTTTTTALRDEKDFLEKQPTPIKRDSKEGKQIMALLRPTITKNANILVGHHTDDDVAMNCPSLMDSTSTGDNDIQVLRLSKTKKLVMTPCWENATGKGSGAWVMNNSLSKVDKLVTDSMTGYDKRTLIMHKKLTPAGDCETQQEWTWWGDGFTNTWIATTGLCRGFAGGAWLMPTNFVHTDNRDSVEN